MNTEFFDSSKNKTCLLKSLNYFSILDSFLSGSHTTLSNNESSSAWPLFPAQDPTPRASFANPQPRSGKKSRSLVDLPLLRQLPSFTIAYDIWLVNGNPNSKSRNHFEHQYSYEMHDIFEIYLSSLVIYLWIMPFIIYRLCKHFHYLYLQLLAYVGVEVTCRLLSLIHNLVFSFNGRGLFVFDFISNLLEALASSILILILISIAKGWTVCTKRLKTTRNFYTAGFVLQIVLITSHMIAQVCFY